MRILRHSVHLVFKKIIMAGNIEDRNQLPDATDRLPTAAGLVYEAMQPPRQPEGFHMGEKTLEETRIARVLGADCRFLVSAGLLEFGGMQCKESFVLEINYTDAEDLCRRSPGSPLQGFGQHTYADFGDKANELALEVCKERGWKIYTPLSTWPKFKALVAPRPKSEIITEETREKLPFIIGQEDS